MLSGDITTAMSLRALYAPIKENPYEKKAKMLAPLMDQNQSGLAAPLLALATGREMANAESWDVQREEEGKAAAQSTMAMYKQNMDQENASKIFGRVIDLAKLDPKAATEVMRKEAELNPALAPFKDLEILNSTKEGWMEVKPGDGKAYMVYVPKLGEAMAEGPDSDLYKKTIIPFEGGDKEDKPKQEFDTNYKTLTTNYFLKNKIDPDSATAEQQNAADMYARAEMGNEKARVALAGRAPAAAKAPTSATYNQATGILVDKWLPEAEKNGNKIPVDTLTGRPSPAAVRAALPPEARGQFDRQLIDTQDGIENGLSPARAVDGALKKWSNQPATPTGGGSSSANRPFTREDVLAEIKRRKAGGR